MPGAKLVLSTKQRLGDRDENAEKKTLRLVCPWVFEDHLFHPFSGNQGVFLLGLHGFNGELVLKLVFSQNLSESIPFFARLHTTWRGPAHLPIPMTDPWDGR